MVILSGLLSHTPTLSHRHTLACGGFLAQKDNKLSESLGGLESCWRCMRVVIYALRFLLEGQ